MTFDQAQQLEHLFGRNPNPSSVFCKEVGTMLGMRWHHVQRWFNMRYPVAQRNEPHRAKVGKFPEMAIRAPGSSRSSLSVKDFALPISPSGPRDDQDLLLLLNEYNCKPLGFMWLFSTKKSCYSHFAQPFD